MLERNLDFIHINGERLPSPKTLRELEDEFFLAARVKAEPREGYKAENDLGRVITLRPNADPGYIATQVENHKNRGIFSWGRRNVDLVTFAIYTPYPIKQKKSPTKVLETAIGLFTVTLINEGYSIPAGGVLYTKSKRK